MVGYYPEDRCLSMFIALRWMQEPCGVMMWVAENIQAYLRIFRRAQHQWRVRDSASTARGFYCFCLMAQIEVQRVQEVQEVQIRSIRLIRGKNEKTTGQVLSLFLSSTLVIQHHLPYNIRYSHFITTLLYSLTAHHCP